MNFINVRLKIHHASARCASPCRTGAMTLLAFARVLDDKLAAIARAATVPDYLVRATCLLHRTPDTSGIFWQGYRLHAVLGRKFYGVWNAVSQATQSTPRSSSLVENLNSRLRNCLSLRCHLNGSRGWVDLLQFFFSHRRFMRSRCSEGIGKSPREAMTGEDHPHWSTLLGLGPLQPRQS
jgi:hypothetical protein